MANFNRVMGFALAHFFRNRGTSVAAIFILTITTLLITGLFFARGAGNYMIEEVQNKIGITAYFKEDTSEEAILQVRQELLQDTAVVRSVEYVSKEQALADFSAAYQDDPTIVRALAEVGQNPLLPSLNIITNGNTAEYEVIAGVLAQEKYAVLVEEVDFSKRRDTIEKAFDVMDSITKFGLALAVIFLLVAILVVFNTIKLIVETSGQEISTMRIVGASDWFIRAPFVIQGLIFGAISFAICFIATAGLSYFLSSGISAIMPGFNLFRFFLANLFLIIIIQLAAGAGLASLLSFVVVRKYLKV